MNFKNISSHGHKSLVASKKKKKKGKIKDRKRKSNIKHKQANKPTKERNDWAENA